jgi:hypothetical protein
MWSSSMPGVPAIMPARSVTNWRRASYLRRRGGERVAQSSVEPADDEVVGLGEQVPVDVGGDLDTGR